MICVKRNSLEYFDNTNAIENLNSLNDLEIKYLSILAVLYLKFFTDLLKFWLLLDEHLDLLLRPPVDQKVKLVKDALRVDIMKCTIVLVINMPLSAKRKNKKVRCF